MQAGTNADGRARFVKLPAQVKQPIEFQVQYKDQTASFSIDPGTDCHAKRDVPLGEEVEDRRQKSNLFRFSF